MTFDADPRKNAVAKPIVDKFKAQGYDPEGYTLYTYAAVQVWAEAATAAKSFKTAAVEKAMHAGKFKTVLNEISFDAKGDTTSPAYKVYVWKNGSYDYVNRSEEHTSELQSLMRISYAVFCLKKKNKTQNTL